MMPKFENQVTEHSFLNFSSIRINGDSLISGCGSQGSEGGGELISLRVGGPIKRLLTVPVGDVHCGNSNS